MHASPHWCPFCESFPDQAQRAVAASAWNSQSTAHFVTNPMLTTSADFWISTRLFQKRTKHLYRKEEPPSYIGNRAIPGDGRLDFLYLHPAAGPAGVEAKNGREWHYPDGNVIREMLFKCIALDCIPILVARRFPTVTSEVLGMCGVVLHQTRNQLYHVADKDLAYRAKAQDSLGYDDIPRWRRA